MAAATAAGGCMQDKFADAIVCSTTLLSSAYEELLMLMYTL